MRDNRYIAVFHDPVVRPVRVLVVIDVVTDHHVARLNEGRNLGFWNAGVYVLGTSPRDVVTVTGMLRSVYSGDTTYFEPIRLHLFRPDSNALQIVRNGLFSHVVLQQKNSIQSEIRDVP